MRFLLQQKIILRSLINRKLRLFLSVLGISIGISSVIILMSLGEGSKLDAEKQIKEFGSDLIVISADKQKQGVPGRGNPFSTVTTLSIFDTELINSLAINVKEVAPIYSGKLKIKYNSNTYNTSIVGTTPAYQAIRNHYVTIGEMFNEQNLNEKHRVAVLGYEPYKQLFGNENPINKQIRINGVNFTVIGVVEPKGVDLTGKDMDDQVFIPVTTALDRLFNVTYLQLIYAQAVPENIKQAKKEINSILFDSHNEKMDYIIQDQADLVASEKAITQSYQWLLGGIAVITMLIGGIGIMAMMLVNIKERMKEIGLRRAIGATKKDILSQFITEAIFLGFIGGLLGIIVGLLSVYMISGFVGWSIYISWIYLIFAQGVALLFGLLFGVYPAYKAADLDPIVALRSQ